MVQGVAQSPTRIESKRYLQHAAPFEPTLIDPYPTDPEPHIPPRPKQYSALTDPNYWVGVHYSPPPPDYRVDPFLQYAAAPVATKISSIAVEGASKKPRVTSHTSPSPTPAPTPSATPSTSSDILPLASNPNSESTTPMVADSVAPSSSSPSNQLPSVPSPFSSPPMTEGSTLSTATTTSPSSSLPAYLNEPITVESLIDDGEKPHFEDFLVPNDGVDIGSDSEAEQGTGFVAEFLVEERDGKILPGPASSTRTRDESVAALRAQVANPAYFDFERIENHQFNKIKPGFAIKYAHFVRDRLVMNSSVRLGKSTSKARIDSELRPFFDLVEFELRFFEEVPQAQLGFLELWGNPSMEAKKLLDYFSYELEPGKKSRGMIYGRFAEMAAVFGEIEATIWSGQPERMTGYTGTTCRASLGDRASEGRRKDYANYHDHQRAAAHRILDSSSPPSLLNRAEKQNQFSKRSHGNLLIPKATPSSHEEIDQLACPKSYVIIPFPEGTTEDQRAVMETMVMLMLGVWIVDEKWDEEQRSNPALHVTLFKGPLTPTNVAFPMNYFRGSYTTLPGVIDSLVKTQGISLAEARSMVYGMGWVTLVRRIVERGEAEDEEGGRAIWSARLHQARIDRHSAKVELLVANGQAKDKAEAETLLWQSHYQRRQSTGSDWPNILLRTFGITAVFTSEGHATNLQAEIQDLVATKVRDCVGGLPYLQKTRSHWAELLEHGPFSFSLINTSVPPDPTLVNAIQSMLRDCEFHDFGLLFLDLNASRLLLHALQHLLELDMPSSTVRKISDAAKEYEASYYYNYESFFTTEELSKSRALDFAEWHGMRLVKDAVVKECKGRGIGVEEAFLRKGMAPGFKVFEPIDILYKLGWEFALKDESDLELKRRFKMILEEMWEVAKNESELVAKSRRRFRCYQGAHFVHLLLSTGKLGLVRKKGR